MSNATVLHPLPRTLKDAQHHQLSVRSLEEAELAAETLASAFPEPKRVREGLLELLVNAVEHGNLGISYEEKRVLRIEGRWREEIERRLGLPEYADKSVDVVFQRRDGNCLVQITDMGNGFDWKHYWHINPARAGADHGRSIACVRLTAFDRMAYNDKGNCVTVMVAEAAPSPMDYAW